MSDSNSKPSLHVLIADDEPMIVRALVRVLEKRGHTVESVATAPKGVEAVQRGGFDAVVVDQNMPGDGLEILRALFQTEFDGFAALMTGGMDGGEIDRLAGRVTRIQKPFRFTEVAESVEAGCAKS